MNINYFSEFKPIRNRLRKIGLFEVLDELYRLMKLRKPRFVPEVYEFTYVNALIYCPIESDRGVNFQKEFNKVLIHISALHYKIDTHYINKIDDPFGFIRKSYLNQDKSRVGHYMNQFIRYYHIFSDSSLSCHIETKIGISYYDFMLCSFWLTGKFKDNYHISKHYFFPANSSNTPFNETNMSKVLGLLSDDYVSIKSRLKSEMVYDEDAFLFFGKGHIRTPIIHYNSHLICLYPGVLLKQATAGVYYTAEIYDKKYNLNNQFGKGFEKYIGIILNKLNKDGKYKITPEIKYNKGVNKTSDWIVIEDSSLVFIECKTKRQILETKLYSSGTDEDSGLQDYAANEISKIYKVYNDYRNNEISDLKYDSSKSFIPIIVFLEDGFYLDINKEIPAKIKEILLSKGISPELVDEYPFHIFSVSDFEYKLQIMFKMGFSTYFTKLAAGEISQDYIERFDYIDYFSDDFVDLFITPNDTGSSSK
ncbi:MAG: hypothetical protein VB074_09005 [Proteiniphilum sp.]|jgi:hypothetical protein|uniref:hypothetical protein n=1 Tax=Proteiniphilum sp. TaxID=1926877 RepID=UPI002B20BBC8|nr:hypothetical protein [Proteiniphilum sp.]MEA5128309.1 hypothetical protein [Proteiniphilum sp.]